MEVMPHLKLRDDLGIQYAILPGDPARVERIAEQLEDVEELEFNREYKSIAGTYKGIRMLAVSTGIGGPSTGIAVEELARIGVTHAIRIGSCGALQKEIRLGDLILVQGAVRDEGTSRTYIDSIYPAIPDFELMNACVEAAEEEQIPAHVGMARSHDSFYTDSGLLNLSGTLSQVLAIRNAGLILFCVGKGILFIYIFSCLYFFLTLCVLSPCIIMPSRQLLRQQLHLLGKRRILLHTDMPHILQQS